jgi:hypothetical protein
VGVCPFETLGSVKDSSCGEAEVAGYLSCVWLIRD